MRATSAGCTAAVERGERAHRQPFRGRGEAGRLLLSNRADRHRRRQMDEAGERRTVVPAIPSDAGGQVGEQPSELVDVIDELDPRFAVVSTSVQGGGDRRRKCLRDRIIAECDVDTEPHLQAAQQDHPLVAWRGGAVEQPAERRADAPLTDRAQPRRHRLCGWVVSRHGARQLQAVDRQHGQPPPAIRWSTAISAAERAPVPIRALAMSPSTVTTSANTSPARSMVRV